MSNNPSKKPLESYDKKRISEEFRKIHNIEDGRKVIGHLEILMTEKDGIPRISFSGDGFYKYEYEKYLDIPIVKQFIDFMYDLSLENPTFGISDRNLFGFKKKSP